MNEEIHVTGGEKLSGCCRIHGAKNAVLPILAAALLCDGPVTLLGVPQLTDLAAMCALLRLIGAETEQLPGQLRISTTGIHSAALPERLTGKLRASVLLLAPLLARFKVACVGESGGCAIGSRPVDLHNYGLQKLGARRETAPDGQVRMTAENGLTGCDLTLPFPSVGATENLLMAAVLAKGTTRLYGGATEPEVADLAAFLNRCGGCIYTGQNGYYEIHGRKRLHGCVYTPVPDRIETVTCLAAAAVTGGEILTTNTSAALLPGVFDLLTRMNCRVLFGRDSIALIRRGALKPFGLLQTAPYPGFPTDLQAVFMTLAALTRGESALRETIFENRFAQARELKKMGGRIKICGNTALISGRRRLHGASVAMPDLRAGGGLLLAALAAEGKSVLTQTACLDRGYDRLCEQLAACGGKIIRKTI